MRVSKLKQGRSTTPRYLVLSAIDSISAVIGWLEEKGWEPGRGPLDHRAGRGPLCTDADLLLSTTCLLLQAHPSCAWGPWFKVSRPQRAEHLSVSEVTPHRLLQYLLQSQTRPEPQVYSASTQVSAACALRGSRLPYPMRRSQIPRHKIFNGQARLNQLFSWSRQLVGRRLPNGGGLRSLASDKLHLAPACALKGEQAARRGEDGPN